MNMETRCQPKTTTASVVSAEVTAEIYSAAFSPFFTRSILPAPMFCPTKVEMAIDRLIAGITAKVSTRPAAVKAAMALVPNPFTRRVTAIMPPATSMFVVNGALRGAGDTMIPMLVTVLSLWLIRVPVSVYLSARIGTDGIWWGMPVAWLAGLALSGAYFSTGRWKRLAAVKPRPAPAPAEPPEEEEAEWNVSKF